MSQFNAPAYNVDRPTGQCAMTGKVFQPNDTYIATLIEVGEDLQRVDVSTDAWEADQRPDDVFCYWKATVPEPTEKKKLFVDNEILLELLRRLADAEQPRRIAFRFVLCLILMRKTMLRYDRPVQRDADDAAGQAAVEDWWVLTPKLDANRGPMSKWSDTETVEVLDPHLDEDGIREVTEQLSEILQAEL